MSSNAPPAANPFQSLRDYEEFVYTLKERYPIIQRSTLVVVPRGKRVAVLQGELTRVPAPEMSFTRPNLPLLVAEIERLIQKAEEAEPKTE